MNLSENLKKIRKDNNLSQEDLAEKLGVSRQSVSKWESGLAYPEMDKVLELCKIFNLNIDDLLNQDIKEVEKNKQSTSNVNKYIDSFLSYISKTVNLFSSLKFKDKIKCLFEQCFIGFVLLIIAMLLHELLETVLRNILDILPYSIYSVSISIFDGLFLLFVAFLIIAIMLHIFKIRYLDYYVVVDKEESKNEKSNDEKDATTDKKDEVRELKRKEEKVIIRDPSHAGYSFIRGLVKTILFFIKIFAFGIGVGFAFSLVGLVACFVLSFMIKGTGILFVGTTLGIIGGIIINIILLDIIINFIFNRKNIKGLLVSLFLISLIMIGTGCGLAVSSFKNFKVIEEFDEKYYTTKEVVYKMTNKTILDDRYKFVETNDNNIRIVYRHANYCNINSFNSDGIISSYQSCLDSPELFKNFLNMLNDKVLVDDISEIIVYTSKDNMKKINENNKTFFESQRQNDEHEK